MKFTEAKSRTVVTRAGRWSKWEGAGQGAQRGSYIGGASAAFWGAA